MIFRTKIRNREEISRQLQTEKFKLEKRKYSNQKEEIISNYSHLSNKCTGWNKRAGGHNFIND